MVEGRMNVGLLPRLLEGRTKIGGEELWLLNQDALSYSSAVNSELSEWSIPRGVDLYQRYYRKLQVRSDSPQLV